MKIKLVVVVAIQIIFFISCKEHQEQENFLDLTPNSHIIIDADIPDYELTNVFSIDTRVHAIFEFEENYPADKDGNFMLPFKMYQSSTSGLGVFNMRVLNKAKCLANSCDASQYLSSGAWNKIDTFPEEKLEELTWEFLNSTKDQWFKIRMSEFPAQVKIKHYPMEFSAEKDNVITFENLNEKDSVYLSLLIIPQKNISGGSSKDVFFKHLIFQLRPVKGTFTLSGGAFFTPYGDEKIVSEADAVYLNVVRVKRVIKNVMGVKTAVQYKVNNYKPIKVKY
jgi:hypothetical protein